MIKPPVLRHGDRVAALSLSWGGPSIFPDRYKAGKRQMEQCLGVKLVEGRHTMADATWLAAHLMEAFADHPFEESCRPSVVMIRFGSSRFSISR
jgi:hypothetical protein